MDFSNMNSIEIRRFMAEKGWHSKDSLTDSGWGNKFGYIIWFYRDDWHGKDVYFITGSGVCLNESTSNLFEIDEIVRKCAYKSLKAYKDFPKSIPYQNAKGEIVEEKLYNWENGIPVKRNSHS